jgi:hypothetical protein
MWDSYKEMRKSMVERPRERLANSAEPVGQTGTRMLRLMPARVPEAKAENRLM